MLKKQALQECKESYEKSSISLNAESGRKCPVNGHWQISRIVKLVEEKLEEVKTTTIKSPMQVQSIPELIANIDCGHIKAPGDKGSFEAILLLYINQWIKIII